MAKRLLLGGGAIGAAAALATGVAILSSHHESVASGETEIAAPLQANGPREFCVRSNFNLVEGMAGQCLTPPQFEALRSRPVIDWNGGEVDLALTGPGPSDPSKPVNNCADYDALTAKGWFALSNADMRREGYFKRACGALFWLARARPAAKTYFTDGAASSADIASMARSMRMGMGPDVETASNVEKVSDHVWRLAGVNVAAQIFEIAHADFSGGGLGEILTYVQMNAVGGTAVAGSVGLMEKEDPSGRCVFKPNEG